MAADWILSLKPTFLAEWQALPPKEVAQVHKKLGMLVEDPTPDGGAKKRLEHFEGKICRIRSGDYRVFYTFEKPYVSVLALRKRDEKTYDGGVVGESLGGLDAELTQAKPASWLQGLDAAPAATEKPAKKPLPAPVTDGLLGQLKVPKTYWTTLAGISTQEDLLGCSQVPDEYLLLIDQAIGERPLEQVIGERDLIVQQPDDLIRYKEGELLGFLLKLNQEQQKCVGWAMAGTGPTLLKGGPGTGKSTVALYRAQAMIAALRKSGVAQPRLLFTTYTNALVKFSEQLLQSLLGADAARVEVRTADSVIMSVVRQGGADFKLVDSTQLRQLVGEATTRAAFSGNALQKKAQAQAIERLGIDYVSDEITGVILARRLPSLEAYREAKRPGRTIMLNKTQREAVWRVHEALGPVLRQSGRHLWQEVRALAAERAEKGNAGPLYDGVIVDEAQDLEPSVLQTLIGLCSGPGRLFLTADANQSIYGGAFRWSDIHESLRFQGRTGVLKANHRSTREIGEAAHSYLRQGELDDEDAERTYVNEGPRPAVRAVGAFGDQIALLQRFLRAAAAELRLGLGSFAVLVPTESAGKQIADALAQSGMKATFMSGKDRGIL